MKHESPETAAAKPLADRSPDISVVPRGRGSEAPQLRGRGPDAETRRGGGEAESGPDASGLHAIAEVARPKSRHRRVLAGFILLVAVPVAVTAAYMYLVAADQYASRTGFSVRKEEMQSPVELFGGIADVSGSTSSDADVLYEFIQSQDLVQRVDDRVDLEALYAKPEWDPIFAYDPAGSIEDLVEYWGRMVEIYYDPRTGLIELLVLAFDPRDAQAVANAIFQESSRMVNELSAIAREDATRYTREELETSLERLKDAREALTRFRSRTQIVDPQAELQGRMEVLNRLQGQLAEELVELEMVRSETRENDPRFAVRKEVRTSEAERRIEVIKRRIEEERQKFGITGEGAAGNSYATLVAEFERLMLDREFAQEAYLAAFSAHNAALSEAQRQSRYLAAYVKPTLAQRAEYPQRPVIIGLTALFLFLGWSIVVLLYYSVKDRR